MQDWIIEMINKFGYFGVTLLIAVENLFPPIPSEVILTFSGFMTTYTTMNVWLVSLYATFGSVGGAIMLYGLGRILSKEHLYWIIDRWGRILRLKRGDLDNAEQWFQRRGTVTVFICRFIPIVRSLISIPAGMAKMGMLRFLLYTTIGTAVWNLVLVQLGAFAGANWEKVVGFFDTYSTITFIVLGAGAVAFLVWFFVFRKPRES